MFFLGLELDFRVMRRQLHVAAPIAVAAIAFPFAVGAISSLWLYDVNDQDEAGRTAFVLFFGKRVFGVALSLRSAHSLRVVAAGPGPAVPRDCDVGTLCTLPFHPLDAGAAMSFTAFPVLASILQTARLLRDPLGVLAISCAAIDDITAW